MSHKPNRDYAADARNLGTSEEWVRRMDHTTEYAEKYPQPVYWTDTWTNLDVTLGQWRLGWPLGPAWSEQWSNARPYTAISGSDATQDSGVSAMIDAQAFKDAGISEAELEKKLDAPIEITLGTPKGLASANSAANFEAEGNPRAQGRSWSVFRGTGKEIGGIMTDATKWYYRFDTPFYPGVKTKEDANAMIAQLEAEFPSKTHDWVVGGFEEATGQFNIVSRKRSASSDGTPFAESGGIDPDNPVLTTTIYDTHDGFPREEWATVDLPDGSKIGFLSDGRTFNIPADKDDDWFKDFNAADVKEETIGGDKYLIWPDGTKTLVAADEDKFIGGVTPKDVATAKTIELKDGTDVIILSNGQMIRTGKETAPAKVTYKGSKMTGVPGKFQVTQPDGSLSFVEPVYEQGFLKDTGDYNLFQQKTGSVSDLGLPEVPAQIETMAGPDGADLGYGIRGTQGELLPLNDVLDRVIEQALINGDVDKAVAFDDFRKRPSRTEALQMALQFARSPADQVLISAISSGETHIAPPSPGELQRVGPQADFLVQAYEEFRASLTGGRLPTAGEFGAAVAPAPPPEPTALELANLEAANLRNELLGAQIANTKQAGETALALAANKMDNASAITTSNINSTANGDDRADDYNDWKMGNGDPAGNGDPVAGDFKVAGDSKVTGGSEIAGGPEIEINATPETTDPAIVKEYHDALSWAKQVGVDYGGNSGILLRDFREWIAGEDEAKQGRADQYESEQSMAGQLSDLGIPTEVGDVTDQAGFFEALGLSDKPSYEEVAAALTPFPAGQVSLNTQTLETSPWRTDADIAAFTNPQAAEALAIQQENAARDEMLTEKQSTDEHIAQSAMGTQSSVDAMADIRRIEADAGYTSRAGGGSVGRGEVTMVGESGPELALFPNGTEIIPLDRNVQPAQASRLRRRGVRGMANGGEIGGMVFPNVGEGISLDRYGGSLPSGVRRTVAGQSVDPSAGRLFRAAGLGVPSGQGLRNMLPEDLEIYKDLGAQAGIPEGSFERELALGVPSGERQRGSARFLPLSLRS